MTGAVRVARTPAEPLARCLAAIAAALAPAAGRGLVVLGLDDPVLPGPPPLPEGPLTVLAASGPSGPPAWSGALIAAAGEVAVLHDADIAGIAGPLAGRAPTVTGIPRPPLAADVAVGLDTAGAPAGIREALAAEIGDRARRGPGIALVWGRGAAPLVAAADAWARGRAVVALPGTTTDPLLRRGGALATASALEVVEAVALLLSNEPLTRSLAQRGRRAIASLPDVAAVARDLGPARLAPS